MGWHFPGPLKLGVDMGLVTDEKTWAEVICVRLCSINHLALCSLSIMETGKSFSQPRSLNEDDFPQSLPVGHGDM